MTTTAVLWVVFSLFVLALLALDLFVFHRKTHAISLKEALIGSVAWTLIALAFNLGVFFVRGSQSGLEFLTGYVLERSLSMDNLFVFLLIFSYFGVRAEFQHKVLFWGILGALAIRLVFIFAGVTLIERFHWLIYAFGMILVVSGARMWSSEGAQEIHPERNLVLRLFRRITPVWPHFEGDRFFIRREGRRFATPLFIVLILVETTDVVFAVDSIPAVLAITQDPFIVYTSNVFAIMGMRALYFALAGVMRIFHYLHYGLSAILIFVGVKMMIADFFHIPIGIALGVIAVTLLGCVVASIVWPRPVVVAPVVTETDPSRPADQAG